MLTGFRVGWFHNGIVSSGAICLEEICQGIGNVGCEVIIYAKGAKNFPASGLVVALPDEDLRSPEWWKKQRLDLAIFYRLGAFSPAVLEAARSAGAAVVIESDSDGYISPTQAPWRWLCLRRDPDNSLLQQLKSWKAFYVEWRRRTWSDFQLIAQIDAVHAIKIESELPATILKSFLVSRSRADLVTKVTVIPFAVREVFHSEEVPIERPNRIIAAGRLGAHQKNPQAMLSVANYVGARMPNVEMEVHVRGESQHFRWLQGRWKNVSVFWDSTSEFLRSRLIHSRVLISTSRWETTPIQGLEALCSGCTLVAPLNVPGYASLIGEDEFGRSFRSGSNLIESLTTELCRWESGGRDPISTARHWRQRCSVEQVTRQILQLADTKNCIVGA